MLKYYEDILNIALRLIDLSGIHPRKFRTFPILFSLAFLTGELILGILSFVYEQMDMIQIAISAANVGSIIHAMIKFFVVFFHKNEIFDLIQEMKRTYWPIPQRTSRDYHGILKVWKLLIQANFFYFGLFVVLMLFYQILQGGDRAFPCYVPKFAPKHSPYIVDVMFCFVLLPFMAGVDCLISALFLLLRIQFKILNQAIGDFDYDRVYDSEFKKVMIDVYVQQHKFLLSHCQKLNNIFGNMFMLFIWIEALVMCFQLYVLSQEKVYSLQNLIRPMGMLGAASIELLTYYFMPTHLLMDEASKSADSIVNSNWYRCPDVKVKKNLVFFIMATQRGVKILAGNWIPMSIATCLLIYRTAFSFYTFIKTVSRVKA